VSNLISQDSGRHICNLALIGFMGVGKSCIGRAAAEILGFEFVDTDLLIEANAGITITEIFQHQGEAAFRAMEAHLVSQLVGRRKTVIATGGGLPMNSENTAGLQSHSLVVCLWASPETIYERVRDHAHRPLLNQPNPLEKIRELLKVREPYYKRADVLVSTEMRSVREVAAQVVHHFHMAQAAHP
jgi:shikimate kinase